ncbi:MAG: hypothetical protein VX762_04190 [Bacteroidota bacterium]|nr:hypothetical protein [Bacteroidota bacterium]
MFNKILKITPPIILIGIILLIAYNTYQTTQDTTESAVTVIPTNAAVILQLNDVRNLNKSLNLSNIWSKLQNIKHIEVITKQTEQISAFFITNQTIFVSNSLFISFHKVSSNKSATLFSTTVKREHLKEDEKIIALFTDKITTSEYDNQTIYFGESLNQYFSFKGDILFFSDNKMLLTDAIRTSNENTDNLFINPLFSDSYSTISKSADINLMINYNNLVALINILTNGQSKLTHFSEWTATDVKFKNNAILASGFSTLNSAVNNFIDIFNTQQSQNLNILDIIPESTTQLFAISFNNQQRLYEKKNEILQNKNEFWNWNKNRKVMEDSSNVHYNEFIDEADNEAGIFNTSPSVSIDNAYTYFNTKEAIRATSLLQGMIISSYNYKNFKINKITDNNLTANLFGILFNPNNPFFTTINDYFIFGNSVASLEYIIDNYTSKNILSKNKSFKKLNSYISKDANIFLYVNPGKISEALKNSLIDTEFFSYNPDSMAKFTAFSLQINTTKKRMLHNLCLFHDDEYKEAIKEEWYYPLDTSLTIHPQFVNNHFTKEKMILVQDKFNNLIALNTLGEKLWSKQINNKILGKINFIDAYKNNKFQALFNTSHQLYLLDRNGKFVDGFPKNLPTTTSIGHSLFDYNKNKKYRIIIVGDNNMLYNLDSKGKSVTGWKYRKSTNRIKQSPIHFVVNNKDYILNATNNSTTKLLARNGSDRVVFNDIESFATPVNISENGTLYAITSENKLWTAHVNGTTAIFELPNLNPTAKVLACNDGYYVANQNSISYINNAKSEKINISLNAPVQTLSLSAGYITIMTNTSLYLIKNNKIVEGFPIDSDGYFNISDIDNNGKTNVINTKNNFIYNYELTD